MFMVSGSFHRNVVKVTQLKPSAAAVCLCVNVLRMQHKNLGVTLEGDYVTHRKTIFNQPQRAELERMTAGSQLSKGSTP